MPNRPPRPTMPPVTGMDIARASGAKVVIGQPSDSTCYAWQHGVIVLTPEVATGTSIGALLQAAEEAAHHAQPRWLHRLRFLAPVRWYEEADAFLRLKRCFGIMC